MSDFFYLQFVDLEMKGMNLIKRIFFNLVS